LNKEIAAPSVSATKRPVAAGERLDEAQMLSVYILQGVYAGTSLDAVTHRMATRLDALGPHLKAVCRDNCFGVLRHRGRIRAALKPLLREGNTQEVLKTLLEVAVYQLEYTRTAPHAVVDFAVKSAGTLAHPAVGGFINAVLRNFIRQREALMLEADRTAEGRHSHPEWWVRRMKRDHPNHWRPIFESAQTHPPLTLRVNIRKTSVKAYLEVLKEKGIEASPLGQSGVHLAEPVGVEQIPFFAEGWVSVQDASAQWAAALLAPQNGERVLDACAAPGGKTAHLLEQADIQLCALDVDTTRLGRVRQNLDRLGLEAELQCADAADLSSWWNGLPFDRILLDAPCTGSGVTRRHPDIRWLRRSADPATMAAQQIRLLRALWRTLKPGGTLLFVTCSLFMEEGPGAIQQFVVEQTDARLVSLPDPPFKQGWIIPDALHDGFFYAMLERAP
jgi:16S rRNA (cytosine967-C5)-methyltransferase